MENEQYMTIYRLKWWVPCNFIGTFLLYYGIEYYSIHVRGLLYRKDTPYIKLKNRSDRVLYVFVVIAIVGCVQFPVSLLTRRFRKTQET